MSWLTIFIIATYAFQTILLIFLPVPSAGSTIEMLGNVRKDNIISENHPAKTTVRSRPKLTMIIFATLFVTSTSLIPLITVFFPQARQYLFPFIKVPPNSLMVISALLLMGGNALTFIAVRTLRSNVSFHDFGEAKQLHTTGIYGYVRNPITVGLATIFTGFFLALPSAIMLMGFIGFLLNSAYRVKMEEVYLERTFGEEFLGYRNQVGKYFPKSKDPGP